MVYLVAELSFVLIINIRKKGTNPCPGPAEHIDDKGNLYLIAWVNETCVILSPKRGSSRVCQISVLVFSYLQQGIP